MLKKNTRSLRETALQEKLEPESFLEEVERYQTAPTYVRPDPCVPPVTPLDLKWIIILQLQKYRTSLERIEVEREKKAPVISNSRRPFRISEACCF